MDSRWCVWMTAGIVAWKVCDRDFECESCPLDEGLRGTGLREAQLERGEMLEFPDDRVYHPAHMWACPVEGHRVRCGADAFAATLLARATSIVLPAPGAGLRQGYVGAWIVEEHRLFPLVSPVTGTVVHRNARIQSEPALLAMSPYDAGFLLELDCPEWDTQRRRLSGAGRQREASLSQCAALRRQVAQSLATPALGQTMADGGERITDLRRLLGLERYQRLVCRLLR
jgi:glycine cleavage system H lipoate-binding protein